ncbi:MAG: TlpA family protein disulfide reductase [Acidobacteria bacterium]|nr:TlpA family protein disulfide reductase [Acidobacteriota bacterium]
MKTLFLALACAALLAAQSQRPALSAQEQPIADQLKGMRKLDDSVRAGATRQLALDIHALPASPNKLSLASALANLSTEGDFGKDALQEVTTTLAAALAAQPPASKNGEPASPYSTLAQLVRYEGVTTTLQHPDFTAAMAALEKLDAMRAKADFTLQDLAGKSWHLSELKGKVVLVNFWATWCPPCRKEMPDLEALYRENKAKGLIVLAISDEDRAKVEPFIKEKSYSFPILLDTGRTVSDQLHIEGIPKTFIYNRQGKLAAQSIDMRTRAQFQKMLQQAGL